MHNFKRIVFRTLLILVFLFGLSQAGKLMYENARDNVVVASAELEDHQGEIETLVMGTSLMHCGVDIQVLSERLDTVGFNLATSSQPLSGTYYLLKDELQRNPVKRVFLGLGVAGLVSDDDNQNTSAKTRVLKMLLSPTAKLGFLAAAAQPKELESLLFCTARTEQKLNFSIIRSNISYKLSDDFKNRAGSENSYYDYHGMGYESSSDVFDGQQQKVTAKNYWDRDNIVEENVAWLKKIGELCSREDVELILVVFPHARVFAEEQGDLADMDAYMEDLAEEISAVLLDYNYTARSDIYEILPTEVYMDKKHLNQNGAAIFAGLLADDYLTLKES